MQMSILYSPCSTVHVFLGPYSTIHTFIAHRGLLHNQTRPTAIPSAIIVRCPLRIDHCILPIALCLLPSARCPSLTAKCLLPMVRPGGMRGAIESAALAVRQELACRIDSRSPHPQITSCRSQNPLKISPSAPAHSAGPPQNDPRVDFVIFKKH